MLKTMLLLVVTATYLTAGDDAKDWKPAVQEGTVTVGDHLAELALPEGLRYLGQADARHLLEQVWHNPPDPSVLGVVLPPKGQEAAWAMVVSWDGEGHVADDDAAKMDYGDLLKTMQEDAEESNPERAKQGYSTVELLGWAEQPHYDRETHKIYWAKKLRFSDDPQVTTLNYSVRILGARGVLELNTIDRNENLPAVAKASKDILAVTSLTKGNRYEDFQDGIDPVKAGGITALIVGGVLAKKVGLLAVIGVFLLKFFKILIIPLVLAGSWLVKWWNARRTA